jgi:hypothetical protein
MLGAIRLWGSRGILLVNVALFFGLVFAFGRHSGTFVAPWDGPTVVTLVLAAATLAVACVTVMVGLLAIWGYATLREHATVVAQEAADKAAERALRQWISDRKPENGDQDLSLGYAREDG